MSAVPETVLDTSHIAVLAHNLRGQVWVEVVYARIDDSNDNAPATQSHSPGRRSRHCGRTPLVDISIMGAGVCRAVVGIIRHKCGLHSVYNGVELGELDIRSVAQMIEEC